MVVISTYFSIIPALDNNKTSTISLQTILDRLNGSYQIRAHNVTMFIPELVISRSGVEISDAKVKADVMEVIQGRAPLFQIHYV